MASTHANGSSSSLSLSSSTSSSSSTSTTLAYVPPAASDQKAIVAASSSSSDAKHSRVLKRTYTTNEVICDPNLRVRMDPDNRYFDDIVVFDPAVPWGPEQRARSDIAFIVGVAKSTGKEYVHLKDRSRGGELRLSGPFMAHCAFLWRGPPEGASPMSKPVPGSNYPLLPQNQWHKTHHSLVWETRAWNPLVPPTPTGQDPAAVRFADWCNEVRDLILLRVFVDFALAGTSCQMFAKLVSQRDEKVTQNEAKLQTQLMERRDPVMDAHRDCKRLAAEAKTISPSDPKAMAEYSEKCKATAAKREKAEKEFLEWLRGQNIIRTPAGVNDDTGAFAGSRKPLVSLKPWAYSRMFEGDTTPRPENAFLGMMWDAGYRQVPIVVVGPHGKIVPESKQEALLSGPAISRFICTLELNYIDNQKTVYLRANVVHALQVYMSHAPMLNTVADVTFTCHEEVPDLELANIPESPFYTSNGKELAVVANEIKMAMAPTLAARDAEEAKKKAARESAKVAGTTLSDRIGSVKALPPPAAPAQSMRALLPPPPAAAAATSSSTPPPSQNGRGHVNAPMRVLANNEKTVTAPAAAAAAVAPPARQKTQVEMDAELMAAMADVPIMGTASTTTTTATAAAKSHAPVKPVAKTSTSTSTDTSTTKEDEDNSQLRTDEEEHETQEPIKAESPVHKPANRKRTRESNVKKEHEKVRDPPKHAKPAKRARAAVADDEEDDGLVSDLAAAAAAMD